MRTSALKTSKDWPDLSIEEVTALLCHAMEDRHFSDAAGLCGHLIERNPADHIPYLYLAELAQLAGDLQGAANFFGEAIVREPSNPEVYVRLGDVLWQMERHEFSIRALEHAIALGRNSSDLRRTLADRIYQTGDQDRALKAYRDVLKADPACQRSKAMLMLLGAAGAAQEETLETRAQQMLAQFPAWRTVHLVTVSPPGYAHTAAFADLAAGMHGALTRLGCDCTQGQEPREGAVNIIFGGHLITAPDKAAALPRATVIFNLEQATGFGIQRLPVYSSLLHRFPVWDYSERNIAALRKTFSSPSISRVALGYDAAIDRLAPPDHYDCDVLFYGSINARRGTILRQLQTSGIKVRHLFNVYGAERDEAIRTARIVLNLHFYPDAIHEIVRTSFLLANHKAVVTECNEATEMDADMRGAMCAVPYSGIVPACLELLKDEARLHQLEQRGYETFRQRDQAAILLAAIEGTRF